MRNPGTKCHNEASRIFAKAGSVEMVCVFGEKVTKIRLIRHNLTSRSSVCSSSKTTPLRSTKCTARGCEEEEGGDCADVLSGQETLVLRRSAFATDAGSNQANFLLRENMP